MRELSTPDTKKIRIHMQYKVRKESILWSIKHHLGYSDGDVFPRPFEIDILDHYSDNIADDLSIRPLSGYTPASCYMGLAPKSNGTFRVVHQLEPLDSVLYTALVYECANLIENYRSPSLERVACSYRISPTDDGSFFAKASTGYDDFYEKSLELAHDENAKYVLMCDIVDFYNQISLHRIANVLEEAGIGHASVVERFLSSLNNSISSGIPVGPTASTLLAEGIMAEIDRHIMKETLKYTRYVDDMRMFFPTKEAAKIALHSLSEYLYQRHRLVLSGEKYKLIPVSEFLQRHLQTPESEENRLIRFELDRLGSTQVSFELNDLHSVAYTRDDDWLSELDTVSSSDREARKNVYIATFKKMISERNYDVGTLRHLLRQARKYHVSELSALIIPHFYKLLPILRDVVIYLDSQIDVATIATCRQDLIRLREHSYSNIPYVNTWLCRLFQNKAFQEAGFPVEYDWVRTTRDKALLALSRKDTNWVKSVKSKLNDMNNMDRRAVIYSASLLSKDEVGRWIKLESKRYVGMDEYVCKYVLELTKRR